jgi:hypothetical protein
MQGLEVSLSVGVKTEEENLVSWAMASPVTFMKTLNPRFSKVNNKRCEQVQSVSEPRKLCNGSKCKK